MSQSAQVAQVETTLPTKFDGNCDHVVANIQANKMGVRRLRRLRQMVVFLNPTTYENILYNLTISQMVIILRFREVCDDATIHRGLCADEMKGMYR